MFPLPSARETAVAPSAQRNSLILLFVMSLWTVPGLADGRRCAGLESSTEVLTHFVEEELNRFSRCREGDVITVFTRTLDTKRPGERLAAQLPSAAEVRCP